ncbi:flagellar hook assembly protein FlgD [Litchfieldia alkalitelluris]|uniref:flagellar hook assembly protein FlgD n=1 Tax=Litchfieldia alkalitelluris TaxID=304268 RepID=UPI0009979843|nr:flagellar hook assembly protein FlgD [Litchfieldia alkalitelluris]
MTNAIDSSLYLSNNTTKLKTNSNVLGKDDFLKILMVQLQNQDPSKPMEDKEFISQMATFSSLEQMTNMTSLLEKFVTSSSYDSLIKYSELIGKQVEWKETTSVLDENGNEQPFEKTSQGIVKSVSQNGQDYSIELQDGTIFSSKLITKVSQVQDQASQV